MILNNCPAARPAARSVRRVRRPPAGHPPGRPHPLRLPRDRSRRHPSVPRGHPANPGPGTGHHNYYGRRQLGLPVLEDRRPGAGAAARPPAADPPRRPASDSRGLPRPRRRPPRWERSPTPRDRPGGQQHQRRLEDRVAWLAAAVPRGRRGRSMEDDGRAASSSASTPGQGGPPRQPQRNHPRAPRPPSCHPKAPTSGRGMPWSPPTTATGTASRTQPTLTMYSSRCTLHDTRLRAHGASLEIRFSG